MVKITIGVPVYNSEKYIHQALDSFVKQTMDKSEFEVICVDDGSRDNSIKVINSYRGKLNLKVFRLPENSGGPGKPRNRVIEEAEGKYIFFVDSDDFIHEEALDRMWNFAEENNSDVLLVKMKEVNGRGVPKSMFKTTEPKVDLIESRVIYTLGPTKMFRTSMLRENNIRFPEGLKSAEDQIFTMKCYLKAKVISVLSDIDYYFVSYHEGEQHMYKAYVAPSDFYLVMSNILDEIYLTSESIENKNKLAASFLNRLFNFTRMKKFTIKIKEKEKKETWMKELNKFLVNHVPKAVDPLTKPEVYVRIILSRNNDLENYERFERAFYNNECKTFIENGKIRVKFDFENDYPELIKMDFTKLNKLEHMLKNITFGVDRLIFTCFVKHTLLSDLQNQKQQVRALFINRDKKVEKIIFPILVEPSLYCYTFEVPFDAFISNNEDIGRWDLFIESTVESYTLRGRVGRNREKYQYRNQTSFIGRKNNFHYRLTPYFTKTHDNFSILVKELESTEKEGILIFDEELERLVYKYPGINAVLPINTLIELQIKSKKYKLQVEQLLWTKNGTEIVLSSNVIKKSNDIKKIDLSSVKINDLPVKVKIPNTIGLNESSLLGKLKKIQKKLSMNKKTVTNH